MGNYYHVPRREAWLTSVLFKDRKKILSVAAESHVFQKPYERIAFRLKENLEKVAGLEGPRKKTKYEKKKCY